MQSIVARASLLQAKYFQAVYYYIRSLAVKAPIMTARDALLQVFEKVVVYLWAMLLSLTCQCYCESRALGASVIESNQHHRRGRTPTLMRRC